MNAYVSQITAFGFDFPPKNWATCAGQLMSIQQNQALFSLLGTTYGGNGIQTFGLPDLRGRVIVGWGQGPGLSGVTIGEASGLQSVTLNANQLPPHNHLFNANTGAGTTGVAGNGVLAQGPAVSGNNINFYGTSAGSVMNTAALANNGSNVPISVLQPYNTINYSICLFGIFPSRN